MTGFGKADTVTNEYVIKIEVRSLNSKFFDLNLKMPAVIREKEYAIRALLNEKIQRGKTDMNIIIEFAVGTSNYNINKDLAKYYYKEVKSLAVELGENNFNPLSSVLKMPEVFSSTNNNNIEALYSDVQAAIDKALLAFDQFRSQEGRKTQSEFESMIIRIKTSLNEIMRLEPERIGGVRERLQFMINDSSIKDKVDGNRFEQELIFYLERMDFTEERVRLINHCDYFLKTMLEDQSNGRKLSFISQEMGREINTLGSKAYHSGIQQQVVMMKDELEKIKEQLMNVL